MDSEVASQPDVDPASQLQQPQHEQQQPQHEQQQPMQQHWYFDERDRYISWLRGEFAAANAIIDVLCQHLQVTGLPGEYDHVVETIERRRFTWTPVLYMQHYYPVGDVIMALQQVVMKNNQPATSTGELKTDKAAELANGVATLKVPEEASKSANSRNLFFGNEETEGEQVNALELQEQLVDQKTCSELVESITELRVKKKNAAKRMTSIQFGTVSSFLIEEETEDDLPDLIVEEKVPAFLAPVVDSLLELEAFPEDKRPDSCAISILEAGDGGPVQCQSSFEQLTCVLSLSSDSLLTVERNKGTGDDVNISLSVGSVLLLGRDSLGSIAVSPSESSRILVLLGKLNTATPDSPPAEKLNSATPDSPPANGSARAPRLHERSMNGYPKPQ